MELVAYLDEAGTHAGSGLTVMAGWVEDVERWSRFDAAWGGLLARNRITHVHGTDLMGGKGPFKGWPRDRRAAFSAEVAEISPERHAIWDRRPLGQREYDRTYIGDNAEMRKKRSAPIYSTASASALRSL